ncbi:hypothetical protein [Pedobacter caeni]|nr:hypothetical protein [Pedobacter caeni]
MKQLLLYEYIRRFEYEEVRSMLNGVIILTIEGEMEMLKAL